MVYCCFVICLGLICFAWFAFYVGVHGCCFVICLGLVHWFVLFWLGGSLSIVVLFKVVLVVYG